MIKMMKIKFDEGIEITPADTLEWTIYYGADGAEITEVKKNGKQITFHVEDA